MFPKRIFYNQNSLNVTRFLQNEVPNVYNYIHELNFQKFYETTTSDEQMAMAFDSEGGLFDLIEQITASLYESWKYDKYIVDKYMLCRRILDGTVPSQYIENFNTMTTRERVSAIKNVSSLMTFRSANYNPAGVRRATKHEDQFLMLDADREAITSTEVLATSYFLNQAEMKTNLALTDTFYDLDEERLAVLLEEQYIPLTETEKSQLQNADSSIVLTPYGISICFSFPKYPELQKTDFAR